MYKCIKLLLTGVVSSCSLSALAVTNGQLDCEDNATNLNCKHPNVVMSGIFDPRNGASAVRCSGSLLKADNDKAIILTAGHCVYPLVSGQLAGGVLGVAFDAKINRVNDHTTAIYPDQFIMGATPIVNTQYIDLPELNGTDSYDYGAIVIPLVNGYATTHGGQQINVKAIMPVSIADEGYVDNLNKKDVKIVDVGYGMGAVSLNPNDQGNNAAPSLEPFATRYISENGLYLNNSVFGESYLQVQNNLAKDQSGVCFGDSGGPTFQKDKNTGQEIQVAIHSLAFPPNLRCNGFSASYRVDIKGPQDFIKCLKAGDTIDKVKACGNSL
ncbi:hypothetical protein ACQUW5_02405 [Legionella sp. CNM-1927-20]|uniref:hypothetical protein n=1 Tax=Legionella sp. CNM-1927-20 TaxID=3422221 RepID=UPI00403B30C5